MGTNRGHRIRLLLAALVISSCLVALVGRLYHIQINRHSEFLASADRMHTSVESILAYRGTIRTREGVILARDVFDYEIGVDPHHMPSDKLQQVVRLVCNAVGKSPEYRRDRLRVAIDKKAKEGRYVRLVTHVSKPMCEEIRQAVGRLVTTSELKGFRTSLRPHRTYPRGTLAGAVVGVVNSDHVGIEGVERTMQPYLSGRDGRRKLIKDATLKTWIFDPGFTEVAPVRGYDVTLTIDSRLQAIVESELEAGVKREKAAGGSFVLMDCHTGDILAMASQPTYAPEHFSEYPKEERLRRRTNKAVESIYEPGSVMKPFVVAYALNRQLVRREQLIRSLITGPVTWDGGRHARFGRRRVTDVHAYPDLTVEGAVVNSSNISLGILGLRLGRKRLFEMFDGFQLCHRTGVELPSEESGWHMNAANWNAVYSPVSVSFGYEMNVTPIQLCRAFASLINGGYLLKPRIVAKISRDGEETVFPPRVVEGRPITEETSQQMREILHLVVEEGTAKWLNIPSFEYGGKTGTAYMADTSDQGDRRGYTRKDYLASFEAFAPFENPRYAALCMIEKPRGQSHYGGMVAGPIVADVLRRAFQVKEETRLARLRRLAAR